MPYDHDKNSKNAMPYDHDKNSMNAMPYDHDKNSKNMATTTPNPPNPPKNQSLKHPKENCLQSEATKRKTSIPIKEKKEHEGYFSKVQKTEHEVFQNRSLSNKKQKIQKADFDTIEYDREERDRLNELDDDDPKRWENFNIYEEYRCSFKDDSERYFHWQDYK